MHKRGFGKKSSVANDRGSSRAAARSGPSSSVFKHDPDFADLGETRSHSWRHWGPQAKSSSWPGDTGSGKEPLSLPQYCLESGNAGTDALDCAYAAAAAGRRARPWPARIAEESRTAGGAAAVGFRRADSPIRFLRLPRALNSE